MTVAVVMDFPNATLDQYDQVMEKMGLAQADTGPEGMLFHWVAATEDGIHVVDVWDSLEQWQAFADTQIGPFSAEVGVPGPPAVSVHQVHNHLAR